MCRRIVLLCLVCFWVGDSVWAQQGSEKPKYIIPPNDIYLLTVASQADCPIQIENAKLLFFIGPGSNWGASYRLRNGGTKPLRIQSITLSMWTAQGVGLTLEELTQDTETAVLPGKLITVREDDPKIEIVPLTDEIRDKMKLRGPLHAVVVLMVQQVKFSDGSVYSDERTSKALQSYFQDITFVEDNAK
jgi:hypothetical protein